MYCNVCLCVCVVFVQLRVRYDVKVASLCDAVAKSKIMSAEQVVKKQTGEEVESHAHHHAEE